MRQTDHIGDKYKLEVFGYLDWKVIQVHTKQEDSSWKEAMRYLVRPHRLYESIDYVTYFLNKDVVPMSIILNEDIPEEFRNIKPFDFEELKKAIYRTNKL